MYSLKVYEQHDAAVCLEMILCKISKQASEVSTYKIYTGGQIRMQSNDVFLFLKAFKGELTIRIKCSEGHSISEETDPFFTLPVSLPDDSNTVYSVVSQSLKIRALVLYLCDVS